MDAESEVSTDLEMEGNETTSNKLSNLPFHAISKVAKGILMYFCDAQEGIHTTLTWSGMVNLRKGPSSPLYACPGAAAGPQHGIKRHAGKKRFKNELVGAIQAQRVPEIPREPGGIWLLDTTYNACTCSWERGAVSLWSKLKHLGMTEYVRKCILFHSSSPNTSM